jgi:hypothetical protein
MQIANYLKLQSASKEKIFIWGFEPYKYYLSERSIVSRFIYNCPLYGDFTSPEIKSEFLADLQAEPPLYFIVVKGDTMLHVTNIDMDSYQAIITNDDLYRFVMANYELETLIEDFSNYRRK